MSRMFKLSFMDYEFGFRHLVSGFVGVGIEVVLTKESRTCSSVNHVLIIRSHGFGSGILW